MPEGFISFTSSPLRTAPEEILLVRMGEIFYTKENKEGSFTLDLASAKAILEEFESRGRDLVIDYEHQTLSGEKAPAAGWIQSLELRSDGVWGKIRYWSEEAKSYLEKGEYRYFSPTILFKGGKAASIHSVALTNHPALHNIDALVANDLNMNPSGNPDTKEGGSMPENEVTAMTDGEVVALARDLLGLTDCTNENVRGKLLALKTQAEMVPLLQERVRTLEGAADEKEKSLLLADLCETGKLSNAMAESPYFKGLSLAELKAYSDATPHGSIVNTTSSPAGEKARSDRKGKKLTPLQKRLGLTEEDLAKYGKEPQEGEDD